MEYFVWYILYGIEYTRGYLGKFESQMSLAWGLSDEGIKRNLP